MFKIHQNSDQKVITHFGDKKTCIRERNDIASHTEYYVKIAKEAVNKLKINSIRVLRKN